MATSTRNRDITIAELLEAAGRLFAAQGYAGCRNQVIADEAGVNKAMINYHFGGKQGLYEAVIEDALAKAEPLLAELEASRYPNGAKALECWLRTLGDIADLCPCLLYTSPSPRDS